MKRIRQLLIPLLVFVTIISFSGCKQNSTAEKHNTNNDNLQMSFHGDYEHTLFNNCSVWCNHDESTLYDNDNEILTGSFFKYAFTDEQYIAVHYIETSKSKNKKDNEQTIKFSSDTVHVEEDYFALYNSKDKKIKRFNKIESFNQYCDEHNIHFEKWFYRDSESTFIRLNDNACIENAGKYRGQFLYINNLPLLEGFIKSYAILDDDKIAINLNLADYDYGPEFYEYTNKDLDFENYTVSKKHYFSGISMSFDVYYEAFIIIDTKNGTYKEFKSKKDISDNCKWIDIY